MAKQPHLLVEPGEIHPTVLLPGDPDRVERIVAACDSATTLTENREYRLVNVTYRDVSLSVCSTGIGSPSAAIAVEELAAVGAKRFLRVGTTGALQREMKVGDLVIATAAGKDEGTTKRYESPTLPAVADPHVLDALRAAAAERGVPVHIGPIVTDDAFYAETSAYVADWEAAGMLAIEMETAAIFTLARRKGLAAGAICTVDGNLVAGEQKGTTEGDEELPKQASDRVARMINLALDAAVSLEANN